MNRLKCSLVALTLACLCSTASASVVYFEDFESFAAGAVLHNVSDWEGWYGDSGAAATVSNKYAYSGTQSVEVDSSADAVHHFDITGGKWVLTVMQYLPSGTSGVTRFHMQNTYGDSIGRSVQWSFSLGNGVIAEDYDKTASAKIIYDKWIELKLVIDLDNDHLDEYYNGELFSSRAWIYSGSAPTIRTIDLYGNGASSVYYDDFKIQDYLSSLVTAHNPSPETGAADVARDVVSAWTSGRFADTHDVYFGVDAESVTNADRSNPLDVLVSQGQDANSFDPEGLLEFGQTYYWRVDEVNAAPDDTIYKGEVWSFTVEPHGYPITGLTATASSAQNGMGPENTINGSGLDDLDQHSVEGADMWMTTDDKPAWIQFEFDKVYELDTMLVWNSNQMLESLLGFGAKSVAIEYSVDGETWTTLEGATEFAQANASSSYTANTTIDFGGVAAQFVKVTITANWGGVTAQTGLAEVRFYYIPVQARLPQPADGETDVSVNAAMTWRAGREAASHQVYFGADEQAVADGTASAATVAESSYTPADLVFATTYYWKVTEVNETETVAAWEGEVWTFTVEQYAAIDDFESYNDDDNRIYETWEDGVTNKASGSQVGYTESPFAERSVVHDGAQAMPLIYDNTSSPYYSEAERTFSSPQDWTAHEADSLCVYYQGLAANSAEGLYLTATDSSGKSKTIACSNATATTTTDWQLWTIPLSDFTSAGVKVTAVKSLTIGVGNRTSPTTGGVGTVYIDDIGYGRSAQ